MKRLEQSHDLQEMLAAKSAAVFVWVHWSTYARHGCYIFRRAHSDFIKGAQNGAVSAFVADLSFQGATPIADSLHEWLRLQDSEAGLRMFPSIDMGYGSVVWIKQGRVTGFEPATCRLGLANLREKFQSVFDPHRS